MSKKTSRSNASGDRLDSYRPLLDRLIFGGALLGMLLVVHLGIQQQRHFAGGCFGLVEAGGAFNCAAVTQSAASELFGVSNVVWGFLFYTTVAALTFGAALAGTSRRKRLKQGRAALIAFGFAYSVYLTVHQFVGLDALCALCLASAGLVTAPFVVQAIDFWSSSGQLASPMPTTRIKREGTVLVAALALFIVLAGADWAYFQNQPAGEALATVHGSFAPSSIALADSLDLPPGCRFDPEQAPVENWPSLVRLNDPVFGPSDAPVTIIEFLDPNCPHCAALHPIMQDVVAAYGDTVRMVYKPIPLWEFSLTQVEALYAAAQKGKFKEMLAAQFAHQQGRGISVQTLQQIARQIGLDPRVLTARLNQDIFRPRAMQSRQIWLDVGLSSVPAVLINGHFVHYSSRTPECLGALIEAFAENG